MRLRRAARRRRFQGARRRYERALAIDEASPGIDHPDTATSLHNLAGVLHD
jgi:hypothetical protein